MRWRRLRVVGEPVLAALAGMAVGVAYGKAAWAYGWYIPDHLARILHADGDGAYDAWLEEIWLQSVGFALVVWLSVRIALSRSRRRRR